MSKEIPHAIVSGVGKIAGELQSQLTQLPSRLYDLPSQLPLNEMVVFGGIAVGMIGVFNAILKMKEDELIELENKQSQSIYGEEIKLPSKEESILKH